MCQAHNSAHNYIPGLTFLNLVAHYKAPSKSLWLQHRCQSFSVSPLPGSCMCGGSFATCGCQSIFSWIFAELCTFHPQCCFFPFKMESERKEREVYKKKPLCAATGWGFAGLWGGGREAWAIHSSLLPLPAAQLLSSVSMALCWIWKE